MPAFQIRVTNKDFSACDGHELTSVDAAGKQGMRAALEIGIDEVGNGTPFFGAEVTVEDEEGNTISRFLVSVGATPLM